MNKQITAVQQHGRHVIVVPTWRWLPWLTLAVLVAWLLHLVWPAVDAVDDSPSTAQLQSLVHWRDAQHDWLLVTDPDTGELVIYDAGDGRPLRRLGADDGLGEIQSIDAAGDRLLVRSGSQRALHVLTLPALEPMSLAAR